MHHAARMQVREAVKHVQRDHAVAFGVGWAVGGELPQADARHVLQDQVAGVTRVDVVDPGATLVMDAVRHGELAPGVVGQYVVELLDDPVGAGDAVPGPPGASEPAGPKALPDLPPVV